MSHSSGVPHWLRRLLPTGTPATSIEPAATAAGVIRLEQLSVSYRHRLAVSHVSGSFAPGALTAIVGPNGAGKTSLLSAITGRLAPSSGAVLMPAALRQRLAWLPQHAHLERGVPLRVQDVVALGLWRELGAFGGLRPEQLARIEQALQAVGLADCAEQSVAALSAGQCQRMLFARVLVQDPAVVLLDEPFNAVDEDTTAALVALLLRWRDEGRTIIAVLHDLALVRRIADQILWLDQRCLAWGPTAEVLHSRALPAVEAHPALPGLAALSVPHAHHPQHGL
ncbi:MAG: hypothetical protein RJA44_1445 [Pseudomonadota bacterium]|jgi:zinc/manganese transport system ATP-binding protein